MAVTSNLYLPVHLFLILFISSIKKIKIRSWKIQKEIKLLYTMFISLSITGFFSVPLPANYDNYHDYVTIFFSLKVISIQNIRPLGHKT